MKRRIKEERHHYGESKRIRKRWTERDKRHEGSREKGNDRIRKEVGEVRVAEIKHRGSEASVCP